MIYLRQAYKHLKAIGLVGRAEPMLAAAGLPEDDMDAGLLVAGDAKKLMKPFLRAMSRHREARAKTVAA